MKIQTKCLELECGRQALKVSDAFIQIMYEIEGDALFYKEISHLFGLCER
jgi:hypothetical protein